MTAIKNVILVGCGNIGLRHLEAIGKSSMAQNCNLMIVESNNSTLERIRSEYLGLLSKFYSWNFRADLKNIPHHIDLTIIATNADVRLVVLQEILKHATVQSMILEKVLFPRLGDLQSAQDLLANNSVNARVNCGRRGFKTYQDFKASINENVDIKVTGSNFGLASNGIHFLDLAEYLNDANIVELDSDGLYDGYEEAKRAGCIEVYGKLVGKLSNGAAIEINCQAGENANVAVTLSTAQGDVSIFETEARVEDLRVSDTKLPETFEFQYVSEASQFYDQILLGQECELVSFDDSKRQHEFFIKAILEHLGIELSSSAYCPIS